MAPSPGRYVDYRTSIALVGSVVKYLAAVPLLPALVAIYYGESVLPFAVASIVMAALGLAMERLEPDPDLGHREAFLVVSLTWLVVPLVGTIPYLVAGQGTVATPVNALFESMSGFTTTGATVLGEISFDQHSRSILIWRQLTQWVGGMGIIVLMVAILPELAVGGAQLMDHEAPGISIEKLSPRIQETARALWRIYLGLTIAAAGTYYALHLADLAPGMTLYNAVAHAFTTLPTGGFSPESRSIEAFTPIVQWAVVPFMIVAGTNFALLWHALHGAPSRLTRNAEFRSYVAALVGIGTLVAVLLGTGYGIADGVAGGVEESIRAAVFQATSIVTTTGYASTDFNAWDSSTQAILLFAMFLGGSAGSAAGSIKIIRWHVIRKTASRELFTSVHPDAIRPIRLGGRPIGDDTIRGVLVFTMLFLSIFAVSTVLIFLDGLRTGLDLSAIEAMSVAIATLGNIGPGFGIIGPMNSFLPFSDAAKLYMVALMWIGRLELLSVLVIFTPAYWRH